MPTLPTHRLALAVFASALLAIASAPWALGLPALNFVFKPLTTLLIIALAWPRGRGQPAAKRWVLALGGALFMSSDALLAIDRFAQPLPLSALWILATYWAAQWCIACWLEPAASGGRG